MTEFQEPPVNPTPEPEPGFEPEPGPGPASTKEGRQMAVICHLSALAGYVVPGVGCVLGPLIVWLMKKDEHPEVDEAGKDAINFQITMLIAILISAALLFACVGAILLPIVGIFDLVMIIMAAIKTSNGEPFKYPLAIKFLK